MSAPVWEGAYCVSVVIVMFIALLKNVAGPDVLMLGALAFELAAGVVDVESGLKGFSNKGLLTVACLFVVAAGISNTGALDYYMSKALGQPRSAADAQLRLMVPIACVSAFLNNTPVVAIMIPIVQKWARKCKISPAQLFIPLSFASILGGTCTLIGTSTNLVVDGMRRERYPDERALGLFELSKFGVPVLLSGMAYMLVAAPVLLPGGRRRGKDGEDDDFAASMDVDNLTVGAVIPRGSPVVDSKVAILRGLNGLYLVSVQRGDMLMRAVRPDFLLEVGDILIFTGLVDRIGEVCEKHGLVPLTHDVEEKMLREGLSSDTPAKRTSGATPTKKPALAHSSSVEWAGDDLNSMATYPPRATTPTPASQQESKDDRSITGLGWVHRKNYERSRMSIDMRSYEKVLRRFNSDIVGEEVPESGTNSPNAARSRTKRSSTDGLFKSSITSEPSSPDALAKNEDDALSLSQDKKNRHAVIRARIRSTSPLVGTSSTECRFAEKYLASIMAVQRASTTSEKINVGGGMLGKIIFQANDLLILHAAANSPLLEQKREREAAKAKKASGGGASGQAVPRMRSSASFKNLAESTSGKNLSAYAEPEFTCENDLEVLLADTSSDENFTEFAIPMRVVGNGALDGKTIRAVDLTNVPGLFMTAIQEGGTGEMKAPDLETFLHAEDVLWFAGDMTGMQTLRRIPGLVPQETQVDKLEVRKSDRRLVQAVVSQGSTLLGKCVRDTHFRTRYDAVIIAVQRSGGRIQARIGDIVLEAGDVLLLDTSTSFLLDHKRDPAFALVSEIEDSAPPQFDKLIPSVGTAVVMIAVFVGGAVDLFVAALLASGVMLATGCLTQEAARAAVKWDVIVTIAAAFGISAAMEQSGVANSIASTLVNIGNAAGTGKPGILVAVYIATVVLCNVVGNNAAAALMFPIAAGSAEQQGIDNVQMSFLLMLAASASFMSPFGYQTNLMVYGPGGYVFANFLKFGAPMQVVQLIVSVSVVLLDDLWWIGWVVGFGVVFGIYFARLLAPKIRKRFGKDDKDGKDDSLSGGDVITSEVAMHRA
eukprot:CAMPEP_0179605312 /NCGR_PEP_ID=MMETSP0930-20121108/851_1 /TAXON_ID=548131 ORGANISM="Ostreococcus mediterraneus, Strain clade-D-RCC1621" /NCGR_SAMPLE_ID=MMETSP0930 /ASSEMBLY_ACC=CAM_ASM_000580 /LENGTH=1050 /DNA_ID=CAMNT_0021473727 /DNA_START=338 /DNA_END=3486 /DNA_ORIENTATION=+